MGYEGAIHALQEQAGLTIHVGGRTALSLLGKAQYLDLGNQIITLFGQQGEKLPVWYKNHHWGTEIMYSESSFLPTDTGMTDFLLNNFCMKNIRSGQGYDGMSLSRARKAGTHGIL